MDAARDDIFSVRIRDKYLLYAPRQHFSALLNRAAAQAVFEWIVNKKPLAGELDQAVELLQAVAEPVPSPQTGPVTAPLFLGLIPSRGCNLKCRYCDFHVPTESNSEMSLELARQAIDAYIHLLQSHGRTLLEVHFFGGEPFFAWEVVFFAVEYARWQASLQGLETRFEVITNGIMSPERCRWVAGHFDTVVLSLDGPAEAHEAQRPALDGKPTYAILRRNAAILAEGPSELALRTCITRENVDMMQEFALWAAREWSPASFCFETMAESAVSRQSGLRPCPPLEFVRNFSAVEKALAPLGIRTILSTDAAERCQFSFCPLGKDALIVSPGGSVEACYWLPEEWTRKGLDLHLGKLKGDRFELEPDRVEQVRQTASLYKEACQDCLCQYRCAGGCHVRRAGHTGRQYDQICFQTRLLTIWRLLGGIGRADLADDLLQDQAASEACVYSPSDRLKDLQAFQ